MVNREQAREIEDAAIVWAAKAARGLSEAEQLDLDRWLEHDSRRLGAFVRAQAAWIHSERAAALGPEGDVLETWGEEPFPPSDLGRGQFNRRILLTAGGALAASVAGGFFILDRPRTIDSGVGEIRQLPLAGGSKLTLDTNTRVNIAKGSGDRLLELVNGKLFLTIASANRPLILSAGGLAMRMAWGSFELESLGDGPLTAFVTNGRLAVSQKRRLWGPAREMTLLANRTFTLPLGADLADAKVRSLDADDIDKLLAWRDGMLSFGNETLATAVREFDRYGSVRIMVTDPQLARQKITGLFKANDPKGFATAIASSFGAAVASDGDILRIFIRK